MTVPIIYPGNSNLNWCKRFVSALSPSSEPCLWNAALKHPPATRRVAERYMIWPAQVLSYKISKLKINPLRERAKKCIETKFDFRAFHDQILGSGPLSLSMLETPVDAWPWAVDNLRAETSG